ncbi:MAG: hypothetical protein NTY04_01130 [Candidatus Staskawiczbacteria bacterium]|nr:hypothetical protein [Candidatus Staskawiczbacteria bacterium]
MYNPESPYAVYCEECYRSDKWDPYSYAQDYNPGEPFFDQLGKLLKRVPKMAIYSDHTRPSINSEYINYSGANKNCYLIFNGGDSEDLLYSRGARFSKDSSDIYFGQKLERCYEGINVNQSSGVRFSKNVSNSVDSDFLINSVNVQDCFGCVNLRHKNNHFLNEPIDKTIYKIKTEEIKGSYSKTNNFSEHFKKFSLKFPRRENNNLKTINCTGDCIFGSKNCFNCFEIADCENCKFGYFVKNSKDCHDFMGFGYSAELLYECVGVGFSQRVIGTYWVENSHDIEYCFSTFSSEYCLGCDGLKHGQYVILNRKYTPEQFNEIRGNILRELKSRGIYGSFMPTGIAPFSYNETIAQDYMPLSKEEALSAGFRWEENLQITKGRGTLNVKDIPDHIKDVADSIKKEILVCICCGRNYKITKQELEFYRKEVIPIPHCCFYCRHKKRVKERGGLKLFDRSCAKCGKGIKTTYAPDRPEIVYCESCYQQEVV